jgi:hypothetical protein
MAESPGSSNSKDSVVAAAKEIMLEEFASPPVVTDTAYRRSTHPIPLATGDGEAVLSAAAAVVATDLRKRVVVGLSTIPSRIPFLGQTLESLAAQTLKPHSVCISVPRHSAREKVDYPIADLKALAKKHFPKGVGRVVVVEEDYGPLTKLAGMLLNPENDAPETLLITVDDDQRYDSRLVETLVAGTKKHPKSVVCLAGHVIGKFPSAWGYRNDRAAKLLKGVYLKPDTAVDVVSGWCGVAYPRSSFPVSGEGLDAGMEDLSLKALPILNKHDDLYISAWCDKLKIKKVVVAYGDNGKGSKQLGHAYKNALSMGNKGPTPAVGIKHTREFWYVIRQLRSKGLLCSELKVRWYRSTVVLFSAVSIILIASTATLAVFLARKLMDTKPRQ